MHPAQARPLALLRSGATLRRVQALVPRRDSYEPQSSHWRLQSRSRLPQRPPLVQRPQNPCPSSSAPGGPTAASASNPTAVEADAFLARAEQELTDLSVLQSRAELGQQHLHHR